MIGDFSSYEDAQKLEQRLKEIDELCDKYQKEEEEMDKWIEEDLAKEEALPPTLKYPNRPSAN